MRAWHVAAPGPVTGRPLRLSADDDIPRPGPDELLLKVLACGVCRTDLHVTEGDLPVHRPGVTPGHEVVGEVAAAGEDIDGFKPGDRAGAAWLRWTDNTCKYCSRGAENLCPQSRYTGWDADGGYAEYLTVPAAYAHRLPAAYTDLELAPLLCAGIIGYHALQRADLPENGRLGLYGFGGSAHLAAQVAMARGATVHVLTRGEQAKQLARELGAASVGDADGAAAAQRDFQHPGRRPRVPRLRRRAQAGRHRAPLPAGGRRPGPARPQSRPLRRRRRAGPVDDLNVPDHPPQMSSVSAERARPVITGSRRPGILGITRSRHE